MKSPDSMKASTGRRLIAYNYETAKGRHGETEKINNRVTVSPYLRFMCKKKEVI